jgi:hypothetical protein
MRIVWMLAATAAAATGLAAQAQPAPAPAPPTFTWTCGPNGYARPQYGVFGDNDGIVQAYEIASPCIPQEVKEAAEAIGMARYKPLGLKNISTMLFSATGRFAGQGRTLTETKLDAQINYMTPAMRLAVTPAGASSPTRIAVFSYDKGWTEKQEGVFLADDPQTPEELAPLIRLTPFGALQAVIEAEGNAKVSTTGGKTVVTGTSPYDNFPTTVTLDNEKRPELVTVRANGHTYTATFSDYRADLEPDYLVRFPKRIVWTRDGRPYADLTVTNFKSNPYVVFPSSATLQAALAAK